MALTLIRDGQIEQSIPLCQEGIELCREDKSFYIMGDLYYHLAYCHHQLKNNNQAIASMKKAITVFDLSGNQKYKEFAEEELKKLNLGEV